MWLKRLLKTLHEVGALGVTGAYASCLVLLATAPPPAVSLSAYAAVCTSIAAVTRWLLLPSLALVTISGLLAIAAHPAYRDAAWAWLKALLGISLFEGTLLSVVGTSRQAAALAALAATGQADPAALTPLLHTEWGGLCLMLTLSFANILLAVWRPRLYPRAAG